jgi:hypothetical protein
LYVVLDVDRVVALFGGMAASLAELAMAMRIFALKMDQRLMAVMAFEAKA